MENVKKPCIGCIYFAACGSTTRTMPCKGRVTKSEKAKERRWFYEKIICSCSYSINSYVQHDVREIYKWNQQGKSYTKE